MRRLPRRRRARGRRSRGKQLRAIRPFVRQRRPPMTRRPRHRYRRPRRPRACRSPTARERDRSRPPAPRRHRRRGARVRSVPPSSCRAGYRRDRKPGRPPRRCRRDDPTRQAPRGRARIRFREPNEDAASAGTGNRTRMGLPPQDFKSRASTDFATPARTQAAAVAAFTATAGDAKRERYLPLPPRYCRCV